MLAALGFSVLFLVGYITHHALHGDTKFVGEGPIRGTYLVILASHVLLSVVALPMVLTTFFFSLSGQLERHRRLARFTLPIWLYVSVTGVVVFVMLKTLSGR
jgi:putative membrane protein